MSVRIGVSPIAWTNDDLPALGGDVPLETCLREAREAGAEGIELGGKFPRDPAVLGPLLARHGLALVSGWYGARLLERPVEAELAALEPHLELLRALGCRVLVFAELSGAVHARREVPLSRRPRLAKTAWAGFGAALTAVAEHTRARGLRLAYHHHLGTVVETPAEIDRLVAATGEAVGLLLDTGHLAGAGGDAADLVRRHGRRLAHVHAKDVRPAVLGEARRRDLSFLDAVLAGLFAVPGDGAVDFFELARGLREAGYAGWLVVEAEQDPALAPPLDCARRGLAHLRRAVAEAGL